MRKARTHVGSLLALLLCVLGTDAVHAQAAPRPVTIAVLEDYPVFRPIERQPDPRAREMRAVMMRRNPAEPDTSVILLNPTHADAHTLAEAVAALTACPTGAGNAAPGNLLALALHRQGQPSRPGDPAAAARWIAELRTQPPSELRTLTGFGRHLTVTMDVCLTPAPAGESTPQGQDAAAPPPTS